MPQGGRSSCDRFMTDEADGHVPVTRRQRDEHMSAWFERYARPRWAAAEPYRGIWCIPQSQLPVLPAGVAGAAAVELGCGSGYVPAWLHRVVRRGTSGTRYRLFALPHGEWIRLMARCGLLVEDLIEVQVPPGAANHDFPEFPEEWVRRWPAEEVWCARRGSARTDRP